MNCFKLFLVATNDKFVRFRFLFLVLSQEQVAPWSWWRLTSGCLPSPPPWVIVEISLQNRELLGRIPFNGYVRLLYQGLQVHVVHFRQHQHQRQNHTGCQIEDEQACTCSYWPNTWAKLQQREELIHHHHDLVFNSILWIKVPTGMLAKWKAFPTFDICFRTETMRWPTSDL